MSHASSFRLVSLALFVLTVVLTSISPASASTATLSHIVVQDTFTADNGTALLGRQPSPTNESGGVYQTNGGGFAHDIQSNKAELGADSAVAEPLSATYRGGTIELEATDLTFPEATNLGAFPRGVGLGFYSSVTSTSYTNFLGLVIGGDTTHAHPQLILRNDVTATAYDDLGAGFVLSNPHTLSYQVNPNGSVSNILVDGTAYSFTTSLFTSTQEALVGFAFSGAQGASIATLDNFTISVPEPASLSMLAAGGLILVRRRCRRA